MSQVKGERIDELEAQLADLKIENQELKEELEAIKKQTNQE